MGIPSDTRVRAPLALPRTFVADSVPQIHYITGKTFYWTRFVK